MSSEQGPGKINTPGIIITYQIWYFVFKKFRKLKVWKKKNIIQEYISPVDLPCSSDSKESAYNAEDQVWSLSWEDSLEKGMPVHSSILAWKIPRTEEPGGLQFMGSQRVGHNLSK